MSLEAQIATLTDKMDALIGAIAANTHAFHHAITAAPGPSSAAASSSSATTAAPSPAPADVQSAPKRRGRPKKQAPPTPVSEADLPPQEGVFGSDGNDDEVCTVKQMREALFELRDAAMHKLGNDAGMEHARQVLTRYAGHVNHVNPKDYAALRRDCIAAIAKL